MMKKKQQGGEAVNIASGRTPVRVAEALTAIHRCARGEACPDSPEAMREE